MMEASLGLFSRLVLFVGVVSSSPCSMVNRTQDWSTCFNQIITWLYEPNKFWFGAHEYTNRCPSGEDSGVFCTNPKPNARSIGQRLFESADLVTGIDRFLELHFESGGKHYNACGDTYQTTESWRYDADPTSGTVVEPWFVQNFPVRVNWTYNAGEYYSLMFYDAGFLVTRGLYVNIPGNDISSAKIIQRYLGPLLAGDIKNPYVFLLFKQNGSITQFNELEANFTKWTIDEFAANMNMNGLVAVNWITVTGDEWSAQTMMDKGGPYAGMCALFATKALLQQDRPFVANNTDLTVWIDLEFMIPENYDMTVCCRTSSFRARNFTVNPLGGEIYSTWDVRTETPHKLNFTKRGLYSQSKNFTGDMYTMIQIDPDVPNPTAGTQERPILHGLVTNIVNGDVTTGDAGLPWSGPTPPDDNPHYYITMLYKQESHVNATDMRYMFAGNCSRGLSGRCLYDVSSAVSKNNLTLVGATWLKAKRDAYVLKRQLDRPGSVEATICQGQPGYSNPCPTTTVRTTTKETSNAVDVIPSIITICVTFVFSLMK